MNYSVRPRRQNTALRSKMRGDEKSASAVSELKYIELLRLALGSGYGKELPINRARVFVTGTQQSPRDGILEALFGYKYGMVIKGVKNPISLGEFDSKTFRPASYGGNSGSTVMGVWDYSWRKVYKYFHYLFFNRQSFFLIIFDMKLILKEDKQATSSLKHLLFAKKLHAPFSPVLMVGEGASDFSKADRQAVNAVIQGILGAAAFNALLFNLSYSYAPVDSSTGENIDALKNRISEILNSAKNPAFTEKVPEEVHRAFAALSVTEKSYLSYETASKLLEKVGLKDDDTCEILLKVMTELGLLTYMDDSEKLRRFIIMKPHWLIDAAKVAIYKHGDHDPLNVDIDDPEIGNQFQTFCNQRVISKDLICHVWKRNGYPREVHNFLLDVFENSLLLADYDFDNRDSFLTPTFFTSHGAMRINESQYQGECFVLDFSGDHTPEIANDGGARFVRDLPFGFFEKLVSLSIQVSASYGQAIIPISEYSRARLSFGVDVDFLLAIMDADEEGVRPDKIKVCTRTGTSQSAVNTLAERMYSMAKGVKTDFYPGEPGASEVALRLLVPGKEKSLESLVDYEIMRQVKESGQTLVIANVEKGLKANVQDYDRWSRDGESLHVGDKIQYKSSQKDEMVPLSKKYQHHVFISYKEGTGKKVMTKQLDDLKRQGFTVWSDVELKPPISRETYLTGVKEAMCYMLVLSENVFDSTLIVEEVRIAVKHNIPIILLHHPDTDKLKYWSFDEYVYSCPEDIRHIFDAEDSIKLASRYYLQESVSNKIVARMREIQAVRDA